MSAAFDALRSSAVTIATQQLGRHVRETNSHLQGLAEPLENRGPEVDEYLRIGGVGASTLNATGVTAANARRWCGMFIFYYYQMAGNLLNQTLPFRNTNLWAGSRLRAWANEQQANGSEPLIIWDNAQSADAGNLQIHGGDIFSIGDGHIGIAIGDSVDGRFPTIEGNQSELASRWEGIARKYRNINDCSIIVRI